MVLFIKVRTAAPQLQYAEAERGAKDLQAKRAKHVSGQPAPCGAGRPGTTYLWLFLRYRRGTAPFNPFVADGRPRRRQGCRPLCVVSRPPPLPAPGPPLPPWRGDMGAEGRALLRWSHAVQLPATNPSALARDQLLFPCLHSHRQLRHPPPEIGPRHALQPPPTQLLHGVNLGVNLPRNGGTLLLLLEEGSLLAASSQHLLP